MAARQQSALKKSGMLRRCNHPIAMRDARYSALARSGLDYGNLLVFALQNPDALEISLGILDTMLLLVAASSGPVASLHRLQRNAARQSV
jgi:hypothetical protein